jgi:ATP-dependent DNA helicase RecG
VKTAVKTSAETTQEKVVTLLRANPAPTRLVLAKALRITADGVKYHLDKLRAAGRIQHHGPTKAGHWEVIDKS